MNTGCASPQQRAFSYLSERGKREASRLRRCSSCRTKDVTLTSVELTLMKVDEDLLLGSTCHQLERIGFMHPVDDYTIYD